MFLCRKISIASSFWIGNWNIFPFFFSDKKFKFNLPLPGESELFHAKINKISKVVVAGLNISFSTSIIFRKLINKLLIFI